jgi:hypothetical protein
MAIVAGAGVHLIEQAGDAMCKAAVQRVQVNPPSDYTVTYSPCAALAGGAWEVASWP